MGAAHLNRCGLQGAAEGGIAEPDQESRAAIGHDRDEERECCCDKGEPEDADPDQHCIGNSAKKADPEDVLPEDALTNDESVLGSDGHDQACAQQESVKSCNDHRELAPLRG